MLTGLTLPFGLLYFPIMYLFVIYRLYFFCYALTRLPFTLAQLLLHND